MVASHMPPTRDLAHNQACALTRNQSGDLSFGLQEDTQPTEPHQSGRYHVSLSVNGDNSALRGTARIKRDTMSKGAWNSAWCIVPLNKCLLLSLLSNAPTCIPPVKEVHLGNPVCTFPLRKAQFLVKNHLFNLLLLSRSLFNSLFPPNPH